jgi:hypothetical protein
LNTNHVIVTEQLSRKFGPFVAVDGVSLSVHEGVVYAFLGPNGDGKVSIFLVILAGTFYLTWLSEAVPASLSGIPPQSVREDGTPANVIHVLDMAWLLPALVITAVSLWRKQPIGYALAVALLGNLVFLALAILAMILVQARVGEPAVIPQVMMFGALFAFSFGMLIWHMTGFKSLPMSR